MTSLGMLLDSGGSSASVSKSLSSNRCIMDEVIEDCDVLIDDRDDDRQESLALSPAPAPAVAVAWVFRPSATDVLGDSKLYHHRKQHLLQDNKGITKCTILGIPMKYDKQNL